MVHAIFCNLLFTDSQIAEDRGVNTVLQISLCEESIQKSLKDVEGEISTIESEMNRLKEKLKSKLNLKLKVVKALFINILLSEISSNKYIVINKSMIFCLGIIYAVKLTVIL